MCWLCIRSLSALLATKTWRLATTDSPTSYLTVGGRGGNRRSFVAVRQSSTKAGRDSSRGDEEILGHCRGVDNAAHPGSRTLVFEVSPEILGTAAEEALLKAQIDCSDRPLRSKLMQKDQSLRALLAKFDSVLVQLMPPWRYTVDAELRAWSEKVISESSPEVQVVPASQVEAATLHEMEVDHYIAQHESWSPAAERSILLDLLAEDHDPTSDGSWNRVCSTAVVSDRGDVLAAALVWGAVELSQVESSGNEAPEVVYLSRSYGSRESWKHKLLAVAGVIASVPVGTELCIDSHLSMVDEFKSIGSIPGVDHESGDWTAIVSTPVTNGALPIALDPALVPDVASWVRELIISGSLECNKVKNSV